MPTTKPLEIGSMRAEETKGIPRWPLKNPTTPAGYTSLGWYRFRYIRSMHSTSRVTWLARTSATLAGRLILRLRSTLLLRERKPLRAVQRRTGDDPASRLGRSLSTCRRATHRLGGLGRSPARPWASLR